MITGSTASILFGEPRLTNDIDLVVELHTEDIQKLITAFPSNVFYCPPSDVMQIEANRDTRGHFNIIEMKTGKKADIYPLGRDALHRWGFARRRQADLEGMQLWVAPLEYVIIRKLQFYEEGGSEKHIRDIKSMLRISGEEIDGETLKGKLEEHRLTGIWRDLF
ncbi:MAG: hypothetical protein GY869_15660 [Planctomycetes bacterium]|nr:hypothetical protein [Planctomycetota bacterium]